jgi:hypothetical protein
MKLYHFTSLAGIIGADGQSELHKAWDAGASEAVDAAAYASPSSILKAGRQPHNNGEYDTFLGGPMPPHVWLTTNPNMSKDFVTGDTPDRGAWRVTVVISSTDRRLVYGPKYFCKRTGNDFVVSSERLAREAASFYVYFGRITLDRFRAVDRVNDEPTAKAA